MFVYFFVLLHPVLFNDAADVHQATTRSVWVIVIYNKILLNSVFFWLDKVIRH